MGLGYDKSFTPAQWAACSAEERIRQVMANVPADDIVIPPPHHPVSASNISNHSNPPFPARLSPTVSQTHDTHIRSADIKHNSNSELPR